jgi:hypothetical protein
MAAETSAGIGGLSRPIGGAIDKAAKAGAIKSIKVKVKMKKGKKNGDD